MSRVESSQNLKERGPNTSRSSDEDEAPIQEQRGQNILQKMSKNKKFSSVVITVVLAVAALVYNYRSSHPPRIYTNVEFDFHVFCPAKYEPAVPDNAKNAIPFLDRVYVVSMQVHNNTNDTNDQSYFYCGLARTWDGSCYDAQYICSKPGPVFDLKAKEAIYVVWMN